MGMNILQDGERIPFIEVKRAGEEGKLLEKLNNFFSGRVQSRIKQFSQVLNLQIHQWSDFTLKMKIITTGRFNPFKSRNMQWTENMT